MLSNNNLSHHHLLEGRSYWSMGSATAPVKVCNYVYHILFAKL